MVDYHGINLGPANVFLVQGKDGFLLVDAGMPRKEKLFFRKTNQRFITPEQIRLIVITHAHFDHTGSLRAIREKCGCPVMIHAEEASLLRQGRTVIPPGTNRFSHALCSWAQERWYVDRLVRYASVEPDILVEDEMSLEPFGFEARILTTPGHTSGSLTVLTQQGQAFIGDLASNNYPFGQGPIFNPIGDDGALMLESWTKVLQKGARTLMPGHGAPFGAERLEACLEEKKRKVWGCAGQSGHGD